MILPVGLFPVHSVHLPRPFQSPRRSLKEHMRQAARGCVLELNADAAARGISDGLFGLVADVRIVLQAATGRPEGAWVRSGR